MASQENEWIIKCKKYLQISIFTVQNEENNLLLFNKRIC